MFGAAIGLISLGVFLLGQGAAQAGDLPVLRLSTLEFGTVNWELDTIAANGFDKAHGFEMQVTGVAGNSASQVAFQGGTSDVIVSDWIWVARQRAAGRDYVFVPYSRAVGGVMVHPGSGIEKLADLKGAKIGIAGGPLDKSWLILQAYAEQQGFDLAGETEQIFAAPPLVYKAALDGEVAGAVNFWHFMAKMKAAGMVELVSVSEAARALGLDPDFPLLGYVFHGEMVREQPDLVAGFAAASRDAKKLLASDDAAWEALRDRMNAASDAEFAALRDGFRAGIPGEGAVDPAEAARTLELMAELGGRELVGAATTLPEGVFFGAEN